MAGIYIHVPFCKQACHYCNFHFSTSLLRKNDLVNALLKEMDLQRDYLGGEEVETIYFGGGTPSLLEIRELDLLIAMIRSLFKVSPLAEITLEANPDDIDSEKLEGWKNAGINRLSIGIQSFFDEDLLWMNRAHDSRQAVDSLKLARGLFSNITIDLIYGTPLLTDERWETNVRMAIDMNVPHLSCYALTVEPKTPLHKKIRQKQSEDVSPEKQADQFLLLIDWLEKGGYEHYEISNFAKPGYRSQHNSSYWRGKKYLGLGPSAHSFDGVSRQWNISNNQIYIDSVSSGRLPMEKEILSMVQKTNEFIMTSLRMKEGLDLGLLDERLSYELMTSSRKYLASGKMVFKDGRLMLTKEGKLFADGIAADLFTDEGNNLRVGKA